MPPLNQESISGNPQPDDCDALDLGPIDLRNLDLSHYVVSGFDNQFSRFNLYAVSNHFGNLEGGHYTAYASSDVHKKWYKFDDQVSQAKKSYLLKMSP